MYIKSTASYRFKSTLEKLFHINFDVEITQNGDFIELKVSCSVWRGPVRMRSSIIIAFFDPMDDRAQTGQAQSPLVCFKTLTNQFGIIRKRHRKLVCFHRFHLENADM